MKKLIFCFMAMLSSVFVSCTHNSIKEFNAESDSTFCIFSKMLNDKLVKGVLDNENCTFYSTEEDENGNLRSLQVIDASKIAEARYVNSSASVSAGDFVMFWKRGMFVYLFKCDDSLPFQRRIEEARRWCAQNLEFSKVFENQKLLGARYPRFARLR